MQVSYGRIKNTYISHISYRSCITWVSPSLPLQISCEMPACFWKRPLFMQSYRCSVFWSFSFIHWSFHISVVSLYQSHFFTSVVISRHSKTMQKHIMTKCGGKRILLAHIYFQVIKEWWNWIFLLTPALIFPSWEKNPWTRANGWLIRELYNIFAINIFCF